LDTLEPALVDWNRGFVGLYWLGLIADKKQEGCFFLRNAVC